jgi:hypothetical protein
MDILVQHIADAVREIDRSAVPFKTFQPGVGPYGEPQLTKLIVDRLRAQDANLYHGIRTRRQPDVLVPGKWAIEIKIVRPFGDNGREAEHWSQNLLHPYPGNVSAIGDALKLLQHQGPERRGLVVITYQHEPPRIDLSVLISGFELLARNLVGLPLGERHSRVIDACIHPVHRRATINGWELGH